jgi:putative ABC transport system substrate-binding protein
MELFFTSGDRFIHDARREVVGTHPDVIAALSGKLALAFKAVTKEIPIVTNPADPVAQGIVQSLAHPAGNITGVSADGGLQLYEKWVELLNELVPKLSSLFLLASQRQWERNEFGVAIRAGAKRAGNSLVPILLGSTFEEAAYARAFKSMERDRADALLVSNEGEHLVYRAALVRLVAEQRLPAMYPFRAFVDSGGLMTYSNDLGDLMRRLAATAAGILKGKKPQDIPFSQPTKFELIINLKTARSQAWSLAAPLVAAVAQQAPLDPATYFISFSGPAAVCKSSIPWGGPPPHLQRIVGVRIRPTGVGRFFGSIIAPWPAARNTHGSDPAIRAFPSARQWLGTGAVTAVPLGPCQILAVPSATRGTIHRIARRTKWIENQTTLPLVRGSRSTSLEPLAAQV